jgi:hypothetical protein
MAPPKSDKAPDVTEKETVAPAKPKSEPKIDPLEKYKSVLPNGLTVYNFVN